MLGLPVRGFFSVGAGIHGGQKIPTLIYVRAIRLRASPAMSPARPPVPCFFIRTAKIGPVAPPIPQFCPDLGLHPSGEPRPSRAFWGVLGDSGQKKCARNSNETSCALCGPNLSMREIGRRPHRLVLHASSSSLRIIFRAL
jgi:hypothetical protein